MGLVLKGPPADAGDVRDVGSTPLSGRSPGVATHPSIIAPGNPMGRRAWRATVHGVAQFGHS